MNKLHDSKASPFPSTEAEVDWLDEDDLILLEEVRPVATASTWGCRHEETQRIWRPQIG